MAVEVAVRGMMILRPRRPPERHRHRPYGERDDGRRGDGADGHLGANRPELMAALCKSMSRTISAWQARSSAVLARSSP